MGTFLRQNMFDVQNSLTDGFVYQYVLPPLITHVTSSRIVREENKEKLLQFFNAFKPAQLIGQIQPAEHKNIEKSSPTHLLLIACAYFLQNINRYDMYLINVCFNLGMDAKDVFLILLINNLEDTNDFCRENSIHGHNYFAIVRLKKLSALYKLTSSYQ